MGSRTYGDRITFKEEEGRSETEGKEVKMFK